MFSREPPRILVLLPQGLYHLLFTSETGLALQGLGSVTFNAADENWDAGALAARIGGQDIVVTGWGSPSFDSPVLEAADALELVVHSAGSVKHLFPPRLFQSGVRVSHAAAAIAPAVAEMSLTLLLMMLREPHRMDRALRAGTPWGEARDATMGRELRGLRVGVIGAGYTGREFMRALRCLGAEVWVFDPYLAAGDARELGAVSAELDDVMRSCPAVSLQAPSTPETYRMIGERELGLMQDDAILINTARSWLVDETALIDALAAGRIRAAIDVFEDEPLPADHPLRTLPNVLLTPHVAGASVQARTRQGQIVVDEISRYVAGEPLQYEVTEDMLERMA